MITKQEITDWIEEHNAQDWSIAEICDAMLSEIINNTIWADDVFPNIKEKLLAEVHRYTGAYNHE